MSHAHVLLGAHKREDMDNSDYQYENHMDRLYLYLCRLTSIRYRPLSVEEYGSIIS